jgi:hypothetical protein
MEKITLQYIAGFFDGEGSIGIYYHNKAKDGFHLRTQLTNNENKDALRLVNYLMNKFGGNLSEQITLSGRVKYNWQLNSDKAVYFLRKIEPYLIFKKDQAIIAINWQEQRPPLIRDRRGRIQIKRKRRIDFDIKTSRLIKALKKEDLATVLEKQKDLINVAKELMPLKTTKENKKFAKEGIQPNELFR